MSHKDTKNVTKKTIICPLCSNIYIKKYISQHFKSQHPNSEYSKIIKKGMVYPTYFNSNKIFIQNTEFYCSFCNKIIKKNSKYHHNKSKLHLDLVKKSKHNNLIFTHDEVNNDNYNNGNNIFYNKLTLESDNESNSLISKFNLENKAFINLMNKPQEKYNNLKINENKRTEFFPLDKINTNINLNAYKNNYNDADLNTYKNKIISNESSSDWLKSDSIKSLGYSGNFDFYLPFEQQKKFEAEIEKIIEKIEERKKFNKELVKWRDRERKRKKLKVNKKLK